MCNSIRATLMFVALLFIVITAAGYTFALVPDLHGDLVELGIRPRVLNTTVFYLRFAAVAMWAFAVLVGAGAYQLTRGIGLPRLTLAVVGGVYAVLGAMALSRAFSPHQLGPLIAGMLLLAAAAPAPPSSKGKEKV